MTTSEYKLGKHEISFNIIFNDFMIILYSLIIISFAIWQISRTKETPYVKEDHHSGQIFKPLGTVSVKFPKNIWWKKALADTEIPLNSLVKTAKNSTTRVKLISGAEIIIAPDSLVKISDTPSQKQIKIKIFQGEISLLKPPQNLGLKITKHIEPAQSLPVENISSIDQEYDEGPEEVIYEIKAENIVESTPEPKAPNEMIPEKSPTLEPTMNSVPQVIDAPELVKVEKILEIEKKIQAEEEILQTMQIVTPILKKPKSLIIPEIHEIEVEDEED